MRLSRLIVASVLVFAATALALAPVALAFAALGRRFGRTAFPSGAPVRQRCALPGVVTAVTSLSFLDGRALSIDHMAVELSITNVPAGIG